jgi:hypothetical protein
MFVTDDGVIYFFTAGNKLAALAPGMGKSELRAEPPLGYYMWGGSLDGAGMLSTYGGRTVDLAEIGALLVIDTNTGNVTVIDLPQVNHGSRDPANAEPWSGYLYLSPGFAFDPTGGKAFVAHADEDVLTEVDLHTGAVRDHELPGLMSESSDADRMTLQRSVAVSPDGTVVYVASARTEVVEDGESWSVHGTPLGVVAIDTATWETISSLNEPISEIRPSPNGDRLLATGYAWTETQNSYQPEASGLYVLGTDPLSVVALHPPTEGPDTGYGSFSFSEEAGIGYATAWGSLPRVLAIDLASGAVAAEATGSSSQSYLEMMGPIGVMSELR